MLETTYLQFFVSFKGCFNYTIVVKSFRNINKKNCLESEINKFEL